MTSSKPARPPPPRRPTPLPLRKPRQPTPLPAADASAAAPAADAAAGTPAAASSAAPAAETPGESKVRKIESPEPKPVDILAVTGDSVAKRVAPVIGAVVLLILLKILLGRRG
ncbi:MAG: hypothetical protein R2710_09060 [Acidimicrobiales bacterium]